jgi:hypothetical protein
MSSRFARRAALSVVSLAIALPAFPAFAASPEVAHAKPAAVKQAPLALPAELRRVGPITGPPPRSLAGFAAKPVRYVRVAAVREVAAVETAESRQQLLFLVDHRNLDRGPGSLIHMVKDAKPVPADLTVQQAASTVAVAFARPL